MINVAGPFASSRDLKRPEVLINRRARRVEGGRAALASVSSGVVPAVTAVSSSCSPGLADADSRSEGRLGDESPDEDRTVMSGAKQAGEAGGFDPYRLRRGAAHGVSDPIV